MTVTEIINKIIELKPQYEKYRGKYYSYSKASLEIILKKLLKKEVEQK